MSIWHLPNSRVSTVVIVFVVVLSLFSGHIESGVVTLDSIEIYKTHEWIAPKPTVYFQCKVENKTILLDVQKAHVKYSFKGEESWQPLTEFSSTKCKRCGIYEQDIFKADDVFEEWEFCPSGFSSKGKYTRHKDKEFKATFLCSQCTSLGDSNSAPSSNSGIDKVKLTIIVVGSLLGLIVVILASFAGYKYWQKKKRVQDQARFLKLFEDGDDVEDELGLGTII